MSIHKAVTVFSLFLLLAASGCEDKKTFYLPPGSMEATLLTRLLVPVVQVGKTDPLPVLFSVDDPFFYDSGFSDAGKCFIAGNAIASQVVERVYISLSSITCSKNGKATVDQRIQGFVADAKDSMTGLRADVPQTRFSQAAFEVEADRKAVVVITESSEIAIRAK